ncbi:MAG TPA: hypothetical protein VED20_05970, partial [Streptosporangiaceae bacterium]|nr:hypothetical protein [Streptosporangiaceae bacterium]
WDLPAAVPFIRDSMAMTLVATVRSVKPWIAGLAFACFTIEWMTVVGFLPTICQHNGLHGVWPGVLTAVVGGLGAAGSVGTASVLERGVPVRALLIPAFAAMAATSLLAFAVNWAVLPGGDILQSPRGWSPGPEAGSRHGG